MINRHLEKDLKAKIHKDKDIIMPRLNKTFSSNYPKHSFQFINYENAEEFLL